MLSCRYRTILSGNSGAVSMPKRVPLVSQYLERASRAAVEKHQRLFKGYVKGRHGVYALYRRKKLYYVGLASDLRWRLQQHLKDHHGPSWDRFSVYFTIGETHLRELESLILHIAGPPGNKQKGGFTKAENLQRTLKRDIQCHQREELRLLIGQDLETAGTTRVHKVNHGRQPPLLPYAKRIRLLRATLKGKTFKARVRGDGTIRFRGRVFNSPSAAGVAACKRSCDGWCFWKYERAPGDWVFLHELRK